MYLVADDTYCYPGITVLKNLLDLGDSFLTLLAEEAGYPLDLDNLNPVRIYNAIIESFGGSEEPLAAVIRELIA